ncbi:MAG: phage head morphogenesis protein [Paracoccaceae bacterium]
MADEPFRDAPSEVTRYFEAKGTRPSFDWRDAAIEEHAHTFTVAKSAGFDILDDLMGSLAEANRTYGDFGSFIDDMIPTLQKKGWWGRRDVRDPVTGEVVNVQLGSIRRLRTIYWANIRTARAAGEWERTIRTKDMLPFLIYTLSRAENRRLEHAEWVGTVLPVDDPWWRTHYPPNGWLCQCGVRQIGRRAAERAGYDPEAPTPAPPIELRPWTNGRTGRTVQVPRGIDPGWQTNPGATRARSAADHLAGRLDAMDGDRRRAAVADIVGSNQVRALLRGDIPFRGRDDRSPGNIARGRLTVPVAAVPDDVAGLMGVRPQVLRFSNEDAHKQIAKRVTADGGQQLTPADYALVQRILDRGQLYEEQASPNSIIGQLEVDGRWWTAVIRRTRAGDEVYLKSFRRILARQVGESARRHLIRE